MTSAEKALRIVHSATQVVIPTRGTAPLAAERRRKFSVASPYNRKVFPIVFLAAVTALFFSSCNSAEHRVAASSSGNLEYQGAWGTRGTGPGQISEPKGLAADAVGNIYIVDGASGFVNKFSANGHPRLSFQDDRLNLQPSDIAVDQGGAIYVAEARRGSVIIYYPDGRRYREMRVAPAKKFRGSLRVAVDAEGNLYVAGRKPFGIRRYSRRGRLEAVWATGKIPSAVNIEEPAAMAFGPDGFLYVSETNRPVIHAFHPSGEWQRTFTAPGEGVQLSGFSFTSRLLVAADAKNHALHLWSLSGLYRRREDLSAWISGPAPSPTRLALFPDGDCFLLDAPAARILRFRLHE